MDQVTQQNAAMVEETTADSHALSVDVAALTNLVKRFRIGIRPIRPRRAARTNPVPHPRGAVQARVVNGTARPMPTEREEF